MERPTPKETPRDRKSMATQTTGGFFHITPEGRMELTIRVKDLQGARTGADPELLPPPLRSAPAYAGCPQDPSATDCHSCRWDKLDLKEPRKLNSVEKIAILMIHHFCDILRISLCNLNNVCSL